VRDLLLALIKLGVMGQQPGWGPGTKPALKVHL
jgi:hypothetical protein